MKKFALSLLLLAAPVVVHAQEASPTKVSNLAWNPGGGSWVLGVDTSLNLDVVGAFDLKHSQWMTGMSKDGLVAWKDSKKVAYVSVEHLFNMNEEQKGSLGVAVGVMTGTLAHWGLDIANHIVPGQSMPSWAEFVGSWVSIEGGYGYRFFGCPQGQSPQVYTIGGKVKIPLDELRNLIFGSTK